MSKKAKKLTEPAVEDMKASPVAVAEETASAETADATETTAETEAPAKSEMYAKLEAEYAADPHKVIRRCDHFYARKLSGNLEMTWEEFCDLKIAAYTKHWDSQKINGPYIAPVKINISTPEKLAKAKLDLARMKKRQEAIEAALAAAETETETAEA